MGRQLGYTHVPSEGTGPAEIRKGTINGQWGFMEINGDE